MTGFFRIDTCECTVKKIDGSIKHLVKGIIEKRRSVNPVFLIDVLTIEEAVAILEVIKEEKEDKLKEARKAVFAIEDTLEKINKEEI